MLTYVVLHDGTSLNPQTTSVTTAQTLEEGGGNAKSKTLLLDGLNLPAVGSIDELVAAVFQSMPQP
ncbi:MAG: hypothetical protein RR692_02750 [Raoultibacter sp.]